MNRFWDRALLHVVDAIEPRCVVEVGAAYGLLTAKLLEWGAEHDAVVHSIDPRPEFDVAARRQEHGQRFIFHKGRSLNVLGRIRGVDVAFIDGDHNWYTVIHELRLLERTALTHGALPPLIALHDIDWPYGRRDLYYDPDSIPAAHRLPYERKGILPVEGELSHAGLNDYLNNAIYEHSIHNGVRTAIEDFTADSGLAWKFFQIPGLSGVGILATADRLAANPRLSALLKSFHSARFLQQWCEEVERARVRAEIVIAARTVALKEMTGKVEELERAVEQLWDELTQRTSQHAELERRATDLEAALDRAAAEREQTLREHQAAIEQTRHDHEASLGQTQQQLEQTQQQHAAQRAELGARVTELQGGLDRAIAEAEQLRHGQSEELQAALADSARTREELQAALADSAQRREELQAVRAEGAQAREEHASLELQLSELSSRRRQMQEQLSAELERLEREAMAAANAESELRRELTAAKARADEADDERSALTRELETFASGNGTESGAPISSAGARWLTLAGALRSCDAGLESTIAERDPGFSGDRDVYLAISRSALRAMLPPLAAAEISKPDTILDLPCSYGRVARALRAAWPDAKLTTADQSQAAVAFCVEQFASEGWVVDDYLALEEDEEQAGRYDLIWSASLLSLVNPARIDGFVSSLLAMLRPGGVLVAAYHGRDSVRRFSEHKDEDMRTLAQAVAVQGFGFRANDGSDDIGTAAMTPQWLLEHLNRHRNAMVLSVTERGWADHLDVVALARTDVHHPQIPPVLD
jgi:SAM-dependent methyltransferase